MTDETELRDLERRLAFIAAKEQVERTENKGWQWHDTRHITAIVGAPAIADALRYLDLRGLLERKPDAPHLVRVKEPTMTDRNEPLELMKRIECADVAAAGEGGGLALGDLPEWGQLYAALEAQRDEMAQKDARIARLEQLIREAEECVTFEINPSNYDHDDVCELNAQTFECLTTLNVALNEHPRQSAAAIKAEVLEEAARDIVNDDEEGVDVQTWLEIRADRIRREAKE